MDCFSKIGDGDQLKRRKEKKWFFIGKKRGPKLDKLPRVIHDLAKVPFRSDEVVLDVQDNSVSKRTNSSLLFTSGTVLCADTSSSLDVEQCNNRFWTLQSKTVARKIWEVAKNLGVEGTLPDEAHIDMIVEGEKRDQVARNKGVANNGAP